MVIAGHWRLLFRVSTASGAHAPWGRRLSVTEEALASRAQEQEQREQQKTQEIQAEKEESRELHLPGAPGAIHFQRFACVYA